MERIETERLILRKFRLDDAKDMFNNWASDPMVTKYLTWNPHKSVEETKETIDRWEKNYNPHKFAITLKGKDEVIGGIDLSLGDFQEIGYVLSRKHWGKGIMSEACKAFTNYLFDCGFKELIIRALDDNIASNKVIKKCGFKFVEQRLEPQSTIKPNPVKINYYILKKEK
ncbi:MAG: GNAT family N-acetyltransferase [Gammaproteobacteria bacterium]|nr:GNAT family N-acetyltransferase [Gammaproteobacteria bacterium]